MVTPPRDLCRAPPVDLLWNSPRSTGADAAGLLDAFEMEALEVL
ncbi:MAG: hypothetical protein ACXVYB_06130 [Arthrobacter sp.]